MKQIQKFSLASAAIAMLAMPAIPLSAAELNGPGNSYDSMFEDTGPLWTQDNEDRRRRHRRHKRGRVKAGDIFTGIAILGGIAIIADAASKSKKRQRNDYPPQNYPPQNYPPQNIPQQNNPQGFGGNDISSAVNICSDAAQQSAGGEYQVNQIRSVTRDGQGWRVDGELIGPNAIGFSCGFGNGNVQFIQLN